jgi:membrane protease YdiL (CAAX protease family)
MAISKIFVGPRGIRAGWRVLAFLAVGIGASWLLQTFVVNVLGYQPAKGWTSEDFLVSETTGFLAALLATAALARIERRRMREFGLPLVARAPGLFASGLVVGFGMIIVVVGGIVAMGGMTIDGAAISGGTPAWTAIKWGAAMILLGFFEEYMFRGYALVALAEGMRFWPAAVALSLFFGGLHYFTKPMETVADAVSVSLIALLLCLSFRRTGSLWFAAGFHAAFDFAALILFGAPNTGNGGKPVGDHLLATSFHGPAWLTGGPCGLEASWLIFPLTGLAFLLVHLLYPRVELRTR